MDRCRVFLDQTAPSVEREEGKKSNRSFVPLTWLRSTALVDLLVETIARER